MTSRTFSNHFRSNTDSGHGSQQSTAIRGASHACSLTGPRKTEAGINGALAAASSAAMGMRKQGVYRVHLTEGATSDGHGKERSYTEMPVWSGALKTGRSPREQSHSHAAALPVISRPPESTQKSISSTPNSREPLLLPTVADNAVKASSKISRLTDETVIGATSSLVSGIRRECSGYAFSSLRDQACTSDCSSITNQAMDRASITHY